MGSTRTEGRRQPGSGFGWARAADDGTIEGGRSIDDVTGLIGDDLTAGRSVALGFEAPLFIPVPQDALDLCRGRSGEGNRSFAAPAGLAVATLGLHQAAWMLAALRGRRGEARFACGASEWPPAARTLFCWEAFVSGDAHSPDHVRDAASAVVAFLAAQQDLDGATSVRAGRSLSLIGAAALWSGWTSDVAVLHSGTVVIRPTTPYAGPIRPLGPSPTR